MFMPLVVTKNKNALKIVFNIATILAGTAKNILLSLEILNLHTEDVPSESWPSAGLSCTAYCVYPNYRLNPLDLQVLKCLEARATFTSD